MFRIFVAVIVGYLAMGAIVAATFLLALRVPGFAFKDTGDGPIEASPALLAVSLVGSVLAAVVGGFVAAIISRGRRAVWILAGLMFAFGILSAVGNEYRPRPTTESMAGKSVQERAAQGVQPTWYAFTLPFLGAFGAIVGGRLRKRNQVPSIAS
jgi:hypothetical protein